MPDTPVLLGQYDLRLVALSVLIAILASGAALDLAGRVAARQGLTRLVWLLGGAVAMGLGIWSMHYTGMLAFRLPVPVHYHLSTVVISLVAAIVASVVALTVASHDELSSARLAIGSILMGTGIVTMHYVGMDAMRLPATMALNWGWVVGSVVVALVVSAIAMRLGFHHGRDRQSDWPIRKAGSAVVMGIAISGMHYSGMAAARFSATGMSPDLTGTAGATTLGAFAIAGGTLFVLLAAIVTAMMDRRIAEAALAGMLPICAHCKKIRTDEGAWQQVEVYVAQRTNAEFTHSICPACEQKWYGEEK